MFVAKDSVGIEMTLLASIRRHQIRASGLIPAVFAMAWLGLMAAPCAASPQHGSMPAKQCGSCPTAVWDTGEICATIAAPTCPAQGPALMGPHDAGSPQLQAGPPPMLLGFDPFVPDGAPASNARFRPTTVSNVSVQQRYCTYLK